MGNENKKSGGQKEADKKARQWLTPVFRVSHPHLFKPNAMKEGAAEYYSVEMLFDKKKVTKAEIEKPLLAAAKQKWGPNPKEWPPLKLPFRDGDKPHGKKKEVKPEHKGCWVVRASTKAEFGAPAVVDRDKEPIEKPADLYAGCFARAFVLASTYENPEKDGISFILDGVQKHSDGESLGGKKSADQMFGIIEGDDEAGSEGDADAFGGDDTDGESDDGDEGF
jgi:hypothetical protein